MARKKSAKGTGNAKRHTMNHSATLIHKIEKEFSAAPAKLAAQLNKEIAALKQKENKIKAAHSKTTAKVKHSEQKIKTAGKSKKLSSMKKSHAAMLKAHAALTKEWHEITKTLQALVAKHTRNAALRKHLTQFEKEWAQHAKKIQAAAKHKATTKSKAKKSAKRAINKPGTTHPVTEQTSIESFDNMTMDSVNRNETTELS